MTTEGGKYSVLWPVVKVEKKAVPAGGQARAKAQSGKLVPRMAGGAGPCGCNAMALLTLRLVDRFVLREAQIRERHVVQ